MAVVNFIISGDNGDSVITLDAVISEMHRAKSKITDHPVEDGANIADHIYNEAPTVQVVGFVTAFPVAVAGSGNETNAQLGELQPTANLDNVQDFYDKLIAVQQARKTISVDTTLGLLTSMAIEDISIPRNVQDGSSARVTVQFKKVNKVSTVIVKISRPSTKPGKIRDQATSTSNEGKQSESALSQLTTGSTNPDNSPVAGAAQAIINTGRAVVGGK